jgi:hypothetical protein
MGVLASDAVDARVGEQLLKGRGGAASVNRRIDPWRRASSTIAGRPNLLWSAVSQTSRECSMIARATFTSR